MQSGFFAGAVIALAMVLGACGKTDDPLKPEEAAATASQPSAPVAEPLPPPPKILVGTDDNETLEGGPGHDHLTGGAGADTLDGKDGFDYARYDNPEVKEGIIASLSDASINTGDAKGDVYISLQGLVGTRFDDALTGNGETNDIHGMEGNDVLRGLDGIDGLTGGAGDDNMDGGPGPDVYVGGPGNDTFIFRAGEANGDAIEGFDGAGPGPGDKIIFRNYDKGATFTSAGGGNWMVKSADGLLVETIKITGGEGLDASDYSFQ